MEFDVIYQGLITGEEKLALVGLGYVGMPLAVEFAKHVPVIGFDMKSVCRSTPMESTPPTRWAMASKLPRWSLHRMPPA